MIEIIILVTVATITADIEEGTQAIELNNPPGTRNTVKPAAVIMVEFNSRGVATAPLYQASLKVYLTVYKIYLLFFDASKLN